MTLQWATARGTAGFSSTEQVTFTAIRTSGDARSRSTRTTTTWPARPLWQGSGDNADIQFWPQAGHSTRPGRPQSRFGSITSNKGTPAPGRCDRELLPCRVDEEISQQNGSGACSPLPRTRPPLRSTIQRRQYVTADKRRSRTPSIRGSVSMTRSIPISVPHPAGEGIRRRWFRDRDDSR
jgi:hypothetical protein